MLKLLRENPDFRRSFRRGVISMGCGGVTGSAVGFVSNRLPAPWGAVWTVGVFGAAAAAMLYMFWDSRRMSREMLEWEKKSYEIASQMATLYPELRSRFEELHRDRPRPEGSPWLN